MKESQSEKGADLVSELRESDVSHAPNFADGNDGLGPENSYFRNLSITISTPLLGPTPKTIEDHGPQKTARVYLAARCAEGVI